MHGRHVPALVKQLVIRRFDCLNLFSCTCLHIVWFILNLPLADPFISPNCS